MVPSVSCATESPTSVERVNIEFTSRSPRKPGCSAAHAASRCNDWVFIVSVVNKTLSASVTVRPGRCRYARADLELFKPQAPLDNRLAGHESPSERAMSISCTSVVPSPISRILLSR